MMTKSANNRTRRETSLRQLVIVAGVISVSLPLFAGFASQKVLPPPRTLPPLHADGAAIIDDTGRRVVLRGCNLGNWLLNEMWMLEMWRDGDPKDQWQLEELLQQRFGAGEKDRLMDLFRENWIRPRDFETIRSWGFNVVRLPFNYTLLEDDAAPGLLRPNAFQWLDRALEMAAQANIYVILDMHGAPGRQSADHCTGRLGQNQLWLPDNRKRAAFLWKKIAERYRDCPTVAAYDLLNEPYGNHGNGPTDSMLVATMDQLIREIREVDHNHLILCAGSTRGITMYGPPASRGWKNMGYTEHFYPGLFGGSPTLDTHARFISRNLRVKAELLKQWQVPFLVGEFNVVIEKAGGSAMMRRYYDVFASYGWAGTMWSYKLIKGQGGCHPDNWYMVTNRDKLTIPSFRSDSKDEIERFLKTLGTMEYAQDDELRAALTSSKPPALTLPEYPFIAGPAPQDQPSDGWESNDVGDPSVKGGQRVIGKDSLEIFGAGRDVFEGSDECHFVSRKASRRFDLSATVTPPFDTHTYAKAGLMYRTSLNADAPLVMVCLVPDGSCTLAYRQQPGSRLTEVRMAPAGKTRALRLVRTDSHFEATALDADGQPFATQSADLPELGEATGNLGFFVLSHDALLLSKDTLTNIQLH